MEAISRQDLDSAISRTDLETIIAIWKQFRTSKEFFVVEEIIEASLPELNFNLGLNARTFNELVKQYDQRNLLRDLTHYQETKDIQPLAKRIDGAGNLILKFVLDQISEEELIPFLQAHILEYTLLFCRLFSLLSPNERKRSNIQVFRIKLLERLNDKDMAIILDHNDILDVNPDLPPVTRFIKKQILINGPDYILYLDSKALSYRASEFIAHIVTRLIEEKDWDRGDLFKLPLSKQLKHYFLLKFTSYIVAFSGHHHQSLWRELLQELLKNMNYDRKFVYEYEFFLERDRHEVIAEALKKIGYTLRK